MNETQSYVVHHARKEEKNLYHRCTLIAVVDIYVNKLNKYYLAAVKQNL